MSKNTGSTKFRTIDVDLFDAERYEDDLAADDGPQGSNEAEVNSLLGQSNNVEALRTVLRNAPVMSKDQQVKDRALTITLRVLLSFKTAEIENTVKELDQQQTDLLMKYIYKGFENPTEGSSAQLLTWHEKVFAVGGIGSIVRVLTDRKRV